MNPQTEVEYDEDGAVEEVTPEEEAEVRALVPQEGAEAGTYALASMTTEQFDLRLAMLRAGRVRIAMIQRDLLKPGVDYGTVGGVSKPTLLKPGAEKLCDFYRFAATFAPDVEYGDGKVSPPISVLTRCELHLGTLDGPTVAVGYGQANSWERRYRWRAGGKTCPKCGNVGSLTNKPTARGSHWCIPDKGGCGENVSVADAANAPMLEQVENTDPFDLANTLVKMAEKRAHVDATLRATATSGLFTQDMEDQEPRRVTRADGGERASRPSGERGMDSEDGLPEAEDPEGRCPVHNKPWTLKKSGTDWFWADGVKDGDTWCAERPNAAWIAAREV